MSNKFLSNLAKIVIALSIIAGIIFAFTIFSNAENTEGAKEKNEEEVKYLDTKLLTLINNLNNIDLQNYRLVLTKVESENSSSSSSSKEEQKSNEQENSEQEDSTENGTDEKEKTLSKMEQETIVSGEKEVDWKAIEGEIEVLSATWPVIVLDLYKLEVSSEDIIQFSNDLDQAIAQVKNQNKTLTCMYLAKLYGYLPTFLNKSNPEEIKRDTLEAKTYIVNAYAYAETENWDKMNNEIEKAENIFSSLVNDAKYVNDQRRYNINKVYILIEELKNSLATKDTGIFYLKYKNAIEGLNILD